MHVQSLDVYYAVITLYAGRNALLRPRDALAVTRLWHVSRQLVWFSFALALASLVAFALSRNFTVNTTHTGQQYYVSSFIVRFCVFNLPIFVLTASSSRLWVFCASHHAFCSPPPLLSPLGIYLWFDQLSASTRFMPTRPGSSPSPPLRGHPYPKKNGQHPKKHGKLEQPSIGNGQTLTTKETTWVLLARQGSSSLFFLPAQSTRQHLPQ